MNIDFSNLQYQYQLYKNEIDEAIQNVLNKSNYIMGEEIDILEKNLEDFTGVNNAITCGSGTDALLLALMALDIQPGDEIITTPFTFISTAETISFLKAKPVFVDIDPNTYNINPLKIEEAITNKTKIILPVSLFGQPSDLNKIQEIANKNNLKIIIDGAQSFGSTYHSVSDSNIGDISITSFFPAKPLGCFGDGGAVFTNNDKLAKKIKSLRIHGQSEKYYYKYIGMGARMDTIQASILNVKLRHYKKDLDLRNQVADKYSKGLSQKIKIPFVQNGLYSAWAQYSIQIDNRDKIKEILANKGIPTAIHYPLPLHLQECFLFLGYKSGDFPISEELSNKILSLPINPYLKNNEIEYIINSLNEVMI